MNSSTQDALQDRAGALAARNANGIRHGILTLKPNITTPSTAELEVFFFTDKHLAAFTKDLFSISGGHRILAGSGAGQVNVASVAPGNTTQSLKLSIAPVGDYSTYTLTLSHDRVDAVFQDLDFKFRPGCFSIDCSPDWKPAPQPAAAPLIDYQAKDFESFRNTLHVAMAQRVPGWQPSSRADLDETLIDLFAAAGDELSDYQDRVMNEAYFVTCRSRVSLARHARLMDYHVNQGAQASTWLALEVKAQQKLTQELQVRTGLRAEISESDAIFSTRIAELSAAQQPVFHPSLNTLKLYTWENTRPTLPAGATRADLDVLPGDPAVIAALLLGRSLLIQEYKNPATGTEAGRNLAKRQIITITQAEVIEDKVHAVKFVRIRWSEADSLHHDYCFTTFCPGGEVTDCALFHGNLVRIHHGASVIAHYREPDQKTYWGPTEVDSGHAVAPIKRYRYFERTDRGDAICKLPHDLGTLAYLDTPEGGIVAPQSCAHVEVNGTDWSEVISLVHSDDTAEKGRHFAVETDELQRSLIRFGNGVNGMALPHTGIVTVTYQLGGGHAGNVGADMLTLAFEADPKMQPAWVTRCWNPLDVINGRDPEAAERVLRNAPEAFRARQLRAVTLADYAARAEQVPGVARAVARYAWTGSWRTVRVTLDPLVGYDWQTIQPIAEQHLNALHLIGEDIELRQPLYVPLEIEVDVCLQRDCWAEDMRFVLEQEFSTGWTPDGRKAFFHPDEWTFGQNLHRSQIEGRVLRIPGVAHLIQIRSKRFLDSKAKLLPHVVLTPRFEEIFLVENNPDHRERGFITFNLSGGRI